ncbi:MAG: DUF4954 family protein [Spirochaetales bacterium]|nr:DUF4954 family protein [Spirochaetales bacterium]
MSGVEVGRFEDLSKGFLSAEHLIDGRDENALRFEQNPRSDYRPLTSTEIEILVKNNNTAEEWDRILVTDSFDPTLVRSCEFWGLVRLGELAPLYLEYHELRLPVGLSNSTIICCDVGDNVVIRNVHHLSHYIVGSRSILFNLDEVITVNHAKFGNGILKDGEPEEVRVWLEVGNENGGRRILPFNGMLPADAWLWSRRRDDGDLMRRFEEMTDRVADNRRGYYGVIGEGCVIKNTRIIKDVAVGPGAYIKGANKLKNLTVNSSPEEPTQIGEGVELVNGIIGHGNRIFYGVKAVRFLTGRNVQLKYGARLINSFLGANSTLSCCEILNNLIFPFHEQHHNNSFLTSSTVLGQANIAAAATIGSNHNSRAQDGEILAGRGFWPGLATSFKHSSRFASYTLAVKGDYPWELDIHLPFSLIALSPADDTLEVMPAYWFEHNMFAVIRNTWKYRTRDLRRVKEQHVEYDYLAPDTAEEMLAAMELLKIGIDNALGRELSERDLGAGGDVEGFERGLDVRLDGLCAGPPARILHPLRGYRWYRTMLAYYGARELKAALEAHLPGVGSSGVGSKDDAADALTRLRRDTGTPSRRWENLGGQIVPEEEVEQILEAVRERRIDSWGELHEAYDQAWDRYPAQRRSHGLFCALTIYGRSPERLDPALAATILRDSQATARELYQRAVASRRKDFANPFRKITFRSDEEMTAVLGTVEGIPFLSSLREETESYCAEVDRLLAALE